MKKTLNIETSELITTPLSEEELAAFEPEPAPQPNWAMLYARLLAYDLKPIFQSIKAIAKTDTAINWDLTALSEAITTVRVEQALKECLDELIADGYVVSQEHKDLWNSAVTELNFSELVRLS